MKCEEPPGPTNSFFRDDTMGSNACGAADSPTPRRDPSTTKARSPLQSKSASHRIGQGAPSGHGEPLAHLEAMAENGQVMCSMYARLTN